MTELPMSELCCLMSSYHTRVAMDDARTLPTRGARCPVWTAKPPAVDPRQTSLIPEVMTEPIPVSLAIRAVERAIRECDAATHGATASVRAEDERFTALARAGFRALLEYPLLDELAWFREWGLETLKAEGKVAAAVAPLIAHYDATAPGWRDEA